jgi:hypothetical protein
MKHYGWSWEQFEDTPEWVIVVALEQIQADADKREAERQAEDLRRKHRH